MAEVITHVVTAKRDHRHGVAPHDANLAGCGRSGFRAHGRPDIHTRIPIKSLRHQRHRVGAAAAK